MCHDPEREITCGRGNLSFTSINLPRLGIEAHGDLDRFYEMLDEKIDLVIRQLLHRFKIQAAKKSRNYPFLRDRACGSTAKSWMWTSLWVKSSSTAPSAWALSAWPKPWWPSPASIMARARKARSWAGDHRPYAPPDGRGIPKDRLNFTLLATPAEGLSGRFLRIDQKIYGKLPGITDRDYYTKLFPHSCVFPHPGLDKIRLEAPYHALTNAGHISYVELDGDVCKNPKAFEAVIRCMKEAGVGYGSVNHPVDRDPVCGYTGVIDEVCPRCGRREGEGVPIEKLRELRKKFPGMPNFYGLE